MTVDPAVALLASVHTADAGTCARRIEGYWTYELCPGRQVRQYHRATDAAEGVSDKSAEYMLGASLYVVGGRVFARGLT